MTLPGALTNILCIDSDDNCQDTDPLLSGSGSTIVRIQIHYCQDPDPLLSGSGSTIVRIRIHYYQDPSPLLSGSGSTIVRIGIHYYQDPDPLLSGSGSTIVRIRIHYCQDPDPLLSGSGSNPIPKCIPTMQFSFKKLSNIFTQLVHTHHNVYPIVNFCSLESGPNPKRP
jgi:hypothetical protein